MIGQNEVVLSNVDSTLAVFLYNIGKFYNIMSRGLHKGGIHIRVWAKSGLIAKALFDLRLYLRTPASEPMTSSSSGVLLAVEVSMAIYASS